ncbi:heme exporter protein CcmD [Gammaproteobacteria bacterium]|nr:heme exporter protein CcmD [Gammaproteobacteria bacterium]
MSEWLAMGGYGSYVWSGFLITLVVLAGNALWSAQRHRALQRAIRGRQRRQAARVVSS